MQMISYDQQYRIKELSDEIKMMRSELDSFKRRSHDELWDNSDMLQNWKISIRTLATWRSERLIDYIQLGSKIWYTKESRDAFLIRNMVKSINSDAIICSN